MDLSSLTDADLQLLLDAVMNTEDNEAADEVAGEVLRERNRRIQG